VTGQRRPVYILAGGLSTRFGSDKARAEVEGIPMVLRVARSLSPVATSITVVSDGVRTYHDLGLRTIGDLEPGLGPLGGLATALSDLAEVDEWLLLASCDLVEPDAAWVSILMDNARPPATAFAGERWEPLLALYHRSLQPLVFRRLEARQLSMHGLLAACGCHPVPLPPPLESLPQANRPGDLPTH
jgi:molybdopterin-guanine dinucleotide biosynthesis protein A